MATVSRNTASRCKAGVKTQTVSRYVQYAYKFWVCMSGANQTIAFPNFGTISTTIHSCYVHELDASDNIIASERVTWDGGGNGTTKADTGSDYAFQSDGCALISNRTRGSKFWLAVYMSVAAGQLHPTTALLMAIQNDRYETSASTLTDNTATPASIPIATNPFVFACRAVVPCAVVGTVEELPAGAWVNLPRAPAILIGGDSRAGAQEDSNGDGESGICRGLRESNIANCAKAAGGSSGDSFGTWLQTAYGTQILQWHDAVSDHFGVNSDANQPNTTTVGDNIYTLKLNNASTVNTLTPGKPFIMGTSWVPNNGEGVNNSIKTNYGEIAMKRLNARCRAETTAVVPNLLQPIGCFDDELVINGAADDITATRIMAPADFATAQFAGDGIHLDVNGHIRQATAWNPLIAAWNIGAGSSIAAAMPIYGRGVFGSKIFAGGVI